MFRELGKDRGVALDQGRVAELIARKGRRYEELAAAGEMLYPGAADFIRAAAARVPIAIASGALTHEIEEILERTGLLRSVPGDRRRRPDGAEQAASRAVPDGVRAAEGAYWTRLEPWRSVAIEDSKWGLVSARGADLRLVAVTNTYPAVELRAEAELVCAGLADLTLERLDALVSD